MLYRRSASPVVLHSNRPREWICGEFLMLHNIFPLPWRVAGAGARPPPSPLFLRSPSSGHHTSIPCASIFPSTSSTFPNPQPSFSRPESPPPPPVTIGARWKLCSTVDPLLRSSSARNDRKNGFVVSYLCSPAFFPFRCAPPASVNGRRRACCRLSRGVKRYELRTVRLGGPDSPQVRLEVVQRRCGLWWFRRIVLRTVRYYRADSPP